LVDDRSLGRAVSEQFDLEEILVSLESPGLILGEVSSVFNVPGGGAHPSPPHQGSHNLKKLFDPDPASPSEWVHINPRESVVGVVVVVVIVVVVIVTMAATLAQARP
jgi:hypothetical protein